MSIVLHRMVVVVVVVVVVMALRGVSEAKGVSEEGLRFVDAVKGIVLVVVEAA
jgi:hypothetical protein